VFYLFKRNQAVVTIAVRTNGQTNAAARKHTAFADTAERRAITRSFGFQTFETGDQRL